MAAHITFASFTIRTFACKICLGRQKGFFPPSRPLTRCLPNANYVDYLVAATGNDTCMHLADHQEGAQAVSHDAVSDDFDPRIMKSTGDPGCSVPEEAALDPDNPAIAFNTTAGWVEVTNPGALSASWAAATCAPAAENTGDTPRVFWRFLQWNTQKSPHVHADEEFTDYVPLMGHNGPHTLAITKVDGQPAQEITFTRAAGTYAAGPTPRKTNVQNLVITTLSADKGTIDYLKYDPDPESPYNRPRVYFTIKDVGDAHQHYFCVLYLQPTASDAMQRLGPNGCEAWDGGWAVQGPGSYYFEWDGAKDPGDDDPETPGVQHDPTDECDWGTYTYDVGVFEYDAVGEFDWFLYKWPYCLSVV